MEPQNIVDIRMALEKVRSKLEEQPKLPQVDPPGGGGDNGRMEARMTAVESSIVRIDATLDFMRANVATKTDIADVRAEMHKGYSDMVKWVVGTAFAGLAAFITVMTFVLNNAMPKPAPVAQQASMPPIIINVPAQPTPVPGK